MKRRRKLLSILLSLALVVGLIPAYGVTVDAAYKTGDISGTTGSGTASDPVIVDTFSELKAALQSNEDLYIRVDSFQYPTSMNYYPLNNPRDYSTGDAAIRQVGKKHLEVNTTVSMICIEDGNIFATIAVLGELTISGKGRIEGGFNADQSNSVFYVSSPGKLICNGLDVKVRNVLDTYGYAVDNYSGTLTIKDGLFQGWDAPAVINSNNSAMMIQGGTFEVKGDSENKSVSVSTGKKNVSITGGLFIQGITCDDGKLSDLLAEGYSFFKNDYYTNENTLFNSSVTSSSRERLKVLSDKKEISTVDVTIPVPKKGENPQNAVSATENAVVTSTRWNRDGKDISTTDSFEAGKTYTVQLIVKPKDNFVFSENPTVVFNNSTNGNVYASSTDYLYVSVSFTVNDPSAIVSTVNFTNFTLPTNGEKYTSDIRTASDFPGKVTRYDFQMYKKSMTGTTASAGDNVGFVVYVDLNDGYEWTDSKTAYLNGKPQEAIVHNESMGTEYGFMWTFQIGYTDKIKITSQSPETVEYLKGEDVKLFVNATGATGYQWGKYFSSGGAKQQFRPMDIEGATGSTYTISKADSSAEGIYRCTLTCGNGTIYSKDIVLKMVDKKTTNPFVDVTESDYFYEPVLWAVGKGITNGTDATHFSPNATCTRGQVVTFLWRAAGSPAPSSTTNPFTDVNSSDYYYNAVLWAVGKNITNGTSATTFGPNDGCTRGQVVTFLHRFENTPAPASSTNPFVDVSSSEYYYTPVLWAVGKGITNGTDATHFSPDDTCTRGQIVTFLYRDMK